MPAPDGLPEFEFDDADQYVCPCGGKVAIGKIDGAETSIAHSTPYCQSFLETEADVFLAALRLA